MRTTIPKGGKSYWLCYVVLERAVSGEKLRVHLAGVNGESEANAMASFYRALNFWERW